MVAPKYPIKTVADNTEKGLSYKENFKRYNKAKASEFYLECLWILYAMLEDRTFAFLYYLGFTSDKKRSSATGSKKIKQQVRQILQMTENNAKYKFNTIYHYIYRRYSIMEIKWLDNNDPRPTAEPMMALIAHDGSHAYVSLLDDGFEHHILLNKMVGNEDNFEKYFRIIFDTDGADWTFVCPPDYRNMTNKEKRIERFYQDGEFEIKNFLKQIGYPECVSIPKRYSRHIDYLTNTDY